MLAFIVRRALQALGVLFAVGLIAFAMFRFAGDPVNQIVSIDTPAAEREAVRRSLGLDDPVPVQFAPLPRAARRRAISASPTSSASRSRSFWPSACRRPSNSPSARRSFRSCFGILMGVYSALSARQLPRQALPDRLAHRHLAADLSHRHPAHLPLRRDARLAALLWARRHGHARLVVVDRPSDHDRGCRRSSCPPSRSAFSR